MSGFPGSPRGEAPDLPLIQLTADIAHDLNNAMTVIMGRAQLMLMELPDDGSAREDLEEIARSARASADFTRRLLVYAREQTEALEPPEVPAIVAEVRKMLRETLRASHPA